MPIREPDAIFSGIDAKTEHRVAFPLMVLLLMSSILPQDAHLTYLQHIYRQGSAEYFLGLEFWKCVFLGVLVTAALFFQVVLFE